MKNVSRILIALVLTAPMAAWAGELVFVPVKIDGPVHDPANHTYWFGPFAECSSVLDINGDGKLDIAAGRNHYIAPDWTKYTDYRTGAATNGPDVDDNYEGTMDVNNDGRMDVVSSGWMLKQGIYWYENPGTLGAKWKSHTILEASGLEGLVIGNLSGKSDKDLLVNYYARRPGRGLIWMEHIDHPPWFKEHKLGPEHVGVSHGGGIGDINGDGRNDVISATGWFEAPPQPTEGEWIWHPDYTFPRGGAGHPIVVTDANGDGLADIIIGSAHQYGLAWYEQKVSNGKRTFTEHWIETEFPTFHTMTLADLDGDGRVELITGKQLLAHNGGDVGGFEPTFLFYYTIDKGHFQRHILSYSPVLPFFTQHKNDPPPSYVIGTGMRLNVDDMDGDGRLDIIVACRSGLYVFYNKGPSPKKPGTNYMPTRDSYPNTIDWEERRRLREQAARAPLQTDAEGFTVLFNGKDLSNWQPATNWTVEDGVIALKGRTDRAEHNDNYLWTPHPYGDFILELEFKVTRGTNSGIFIRTSDLYDPVYTGIEVQVTGPAPGRRLTKNSIGGLYDLVAAKANPLKPDGWNRYVITCRGSRISIEMNGQLVTEADLDQWPEVGKNPDGTPNKFDRALKDFARTGYIGLQDHGSPVWYRNIRVKRLGAGG